VYAFAAGTGAQLWSWDLPQPVRSSPAVANGQLYVGDDSGNVYAFRLTEPPAIPPQPDPAGLAAPPTPIRHVVIVYQENQSFDGVLGALCVQDQRCDGSTSGTLADGTSIPLAVAPDLVPGVGHTPAYQTTAIDGGKMDGFSLISGCTSSTGYACYMEYQPSQIPNLAGLARAFTISDRTFETGDSSSWGSHLGLAAAQTDGFTGDNPRKMSGVGHGWNTWGCDSDNNAPWVSPSGEILSVPSCVPRPDGSGPYLPSPVPWVPTLMDRLDAAGLTWRIYGGLPSWTICPSFSECVYGPQHNALVSNKQVIADGARGALPNLAIVTPLGGSSQHNGDSMLKGDNWIGSVVGAIENGPEWSSTAIFVTYDDCGCFYDHVPPPPGLGVRVPMVIVSPYAKAGYTDSSVASYSSLLAYVEHAFGVPPLYSSDAAAYDYAQSFDYSQTPLHPVGLRAHRIPRWERQWLREHPPPPDAT
jgi:phospholipase C